MKYSMMSYTVSRQPQHFDLRKMLKTTVELQLDGIDFVTLHGEKAKELRKMADDLGIKVVCHTFIAGELASTDPAELRAGLDKAKAAFEAAVELGAPVVMVPTGGSDKPRAERRRDWINGLAQAAPFAADAGVTLTVENFPGLTSPFVTAADILEAVEEIPGLKITYDNGNAASGEEPAASFERCAKHVVHAHFKDWDIVKVPTEGHREMLDGKFYRPALIGEGDVDQAACLRAMKAAGYEGYINIEYENNKYDPYEATRKAVEYLRSLENA